MIWLVLSLSASADIAPGPFYREDCSVDRKEQEGTTCETCSGSYEDGDTGFVGDEDSCVSKFDDSDYEYVCKTYGASFWSEVWCDGPPREGACGCSTGAAGSGVLLAGLLSLVALRRRERVTAASR